MGRIVGLDIGATAVRGVEVRSGRGSNTLGKAHQVPLPEGAVVNGEIRDADAVTAALRELRTKAKFGTKKAAVALANNDLVIRLVDTEWMPHADARSALRYELSDHIDIGTTDVIHDVHVVREYEKEVDGISRKMMTAIIVAGNQSMITSVADVVAQSGFVPVRMDAAPLALIRGSLTDANKHDVEALVNIGSSVSMVVIHIGGQPINVRLLPGVGGEMVTQALLREFHGWTRIQAEETKIAIGLEVGLAPIRPSFSVFSGPGADQPPKPTHEAVPVIALHMEAIIGHIRESIEHATAISRIKVDRVVLSGGGGRMQGLAERMSSEIGRPVVQTTIGLDGGNTVEFQQAASTLIIAAGLGAE